MSFMYQNILSPFMDSGCLDKRRTSDTELYEKCNMPSSQKSTFKHDTCKCNCQCKPNEKELY